MRDLVIFIPSIEGGGVEKNLFYITKYIGSKFDKIFVITADKVNRDQFIHRSHRQRRSSVCGEKRPEFVCRAPGKKPEQFIGIVDHRLVTLQICKIIQNWGASPVKLLQLHKALPLIGNPEKGRAPVVKFEKMWIRDAYVAYCIAVGPGNISNRA